MFNHNQNRAKDLVRKVGFFGGFSAPNPIRRGAPSSPPRGYAGPRAVKVNKGFKLPLAV
jgi:hypothetical protein